MWLLVGGLLILPSAGNLLLAQDPPARREFTVTVRDFHVTPARIEVIQDDLVKLTVHSDDIAHGFAIDEYRISKRVPAGGSVSFEFRADRTGTFVFYCNLTGGPGHRMERGELVVRGK